MSRAKLLFVFGSLSACGLFAVFFRVMGIESSAWVKLSLSFLMLFIVTTLLFSLGIVLSKMEFLAIEGKTLPWLKLLQHCVKPITSVLYLTLPLFFLYVLTWLILGVFYLLTEIPAIGQLVGILLSFGPFILIFSSLALTFTTFVLLFFLAPAVAKESSLNFKQILILFMGMKQRLFASIAFFVLASAPLFIASLFLASSAFLTKWSYFHSFHPLLVGMQWFFLMLPFNALLTPFVLFFFNFASISHLKLMPLEEKV